MPMIELLTVANHAEAINGLLYLSGAGWTNLQRAMPPGGPVPVNHMGVAIAVLVGWNETNERHRVTMRLENADGGALAEMHADLEMGRPPGLPQGAGGIDDGVDVHVSGEMGKEVGAFAGQEVNDTAGKIARGQDFGKGCCRQRMAL